MTRQNENNQRHSGRNAPGAVERESAQRAAARERCTNIPNDIGYILHEDQISITKLQFDECSFVNTNSMMEIVAFATELALLPSITSFCFTSCSFDHVQKDVPRPVSAGRKRQSR